MRVLISLINLISWGLLLVWVLALKLLETNWRLVSTYYLMILVNWNLRLSSRVHERALATKIIDLWIIDCWMMVISNTLVVGWNSHTTVSRLVIGFHVGLIKLLRVVVIGRVNIALICVVSSCLSLWRLVRMIWKSISVINRLSVFPKIDSLLLWVDHFINFWQSVIKHTCCVVELLISSWRRIVMNIIVAILIWGNWFIMLR